ncbi:hypothetical protein [Fictibacillus sp. 7GRE50]
MKIKTGQPIMRPINNTRHSMDILTLLIENPALEPGWRRLIIL